MRSNRPLVPTLKTLAPGPLPVINAVCEEIGLINVIDESVDWDDDQADLSPGQLIAGLVMNHPMEGQFFEQADPENLFEEGITTEQLYVRSARSFNTPVFGVWRFDRVLLKVLDKDE